MTKVLVVDDVPDQVVVMCRYLEKAGYQVDMAQSGKEALEHVHAEKPDIILLDLLMEEMDGFEVLMGLHRNPEQAAIPVIMVTCAGDEPNKDSALLLGAKHYVNKPIDCPALEALIRSTIGQE